MTKDNAPELMPCREAFEKWFFQHRKECRQRNILLDDNDANSMWHGWEAAWNTRTPTDAVREAMRVMAAALRDAEIRSQRIREDKAVVGIEASFIERIVRKALSDPAVKAVVGGENDR